MQFEEAVLQRTHRGAARRGRLSRVTTSTPSARVSALTIRDWRQFSQVEIEFHPRLTVLTGPNASGKTTLLNVLGRHFNLWTQLYGIPTRNRAGTGWAADSRRVHSGQREIGILTYDIGGTPIVTRLLAPSDAQTYDLQMPEQQVVPGIAIGSHRSIRACPAIS